MALSTAQVMALTTAQIAALNTAQMAAMETRDVIALSTAQVRAIGTQQIAALTTDQVSAMETADIRALQTSQVSALTTDQVLYGLSTTQIAAMTTTQVESFTSLQISVMTTDQIQALQVGTPIILDLNGDGVSTQSIRAGTRFDLFATGQAVQTGWVTGGDGLLVLDRDGDGTIRDGSELFGSATRLSDGSTASNGYVALRELDTNGDGRLTVDDARFADLKLWIDNGDGISQASELKTLSEMGVASLDLNARQTADKNNGNWLGLTSSYTRTDGREQAMADVWFVADKAAAQAPNTPDLRNKIGSLVDVLARFDSNGSYAAPSGTASPAFVGNATAVAPASGVLGMVQAMKQFDANGQPLPAGATQVSTETPGQSGFLDALKAGFLAQGK